MKKTTKTYAIVGAIVLSVVAFLALNERYGLTGGFGRVVDELIARNVDARGGAENWRAVASLRLDGHMDLGQGMSVPYSIEQKRPGRMCLEFEFDSELATQCVDGDSGWQVLPFLGRSRPEPMAEEEFREMADTAEIDGLLLDAARRGHTVRLVGQESIRGRDTFKLEILLPRGAKRWIYLDAETALEVKLETIRNRNGRAQRIATWYSDWRDTDGLLIPHRQDMQTEGSSETHWLTIDKVVVNPPIDDSRFAVPAVVSNSSGGAGSNGL